MLYYFLFSLHDVIPPFRVFRYITFRTAASYLTALGICLILGPWLIKRLREFQIGQQIREEGPSSHRAKAGTPTMGGLLIVIGILIPTVLWGDVTNYYVWITVTATFLFGVVGFMDDYSKISKKRSLGMTGKKKLFFQASIGLGICVALHYLSARGLYSTKLSVPFLKQFTPDMDLWNPLGLPLMLPLSFFVLFIVIASSNAVNLTDGLDGLASGCVIIAAAALTLLSYVTGHARFAEPRDRLVSALERKGIQWSLDPDTARLEQKGSDQRQRPRAANRPLARAIDSGYCSR